LTHIADGAEEMRKDVKIGQFAIFTVAGYVSDSYCFAAGSFTDPPVFRNAPRPALAARYPRG
jgi:hypothetical protein